MGGRSVVMACTVAKPCHAPDGVSPPPAGPILGPVSPLEAPTISEPIIELTAAAHAKLLELRADEEEPERLGLRLEVVSAPGADFRYDLSFDVVTKAAFTDEVRNHDGLRVIIPGKDMEAVRGATLDYSDDAGLVLRNPNRPQVARPEGMLHGDELSARIEAVISGEVNPALAAHGGFVTFVGHDGEGTAFLTMGGGCHGCSMSRLTMLDGVQTMLVEQVDGVLKVQDITDHETGENPYYS
jgi:Fe/S biogenesis protein NfuA